MPPGGAFGSNRDLQYPSTDVKQLRHACVSDDIPPVVPVFRTANPAVISPVPAAVPTSASRSMQHTSFFIASVKRFPQIILLLPGTIRTALSEKKNFWNRNLPGTSVKWFPFTPLGVSHCIAVTIDFRFMALAVTGTCQAGKLVPGPAYAIEKAPGRRVRIKQGHTISLNRLETAQACLCLR
jgi:hypothetical protein